MKKILIILAFALGVISVLNAQNVCETRGIGTNDAWAIYFDGRTMYAPSNTVTRSFGVGFSRTGDISVNVGKSSTTEEIKGRLIPKGARVNVFPNANKNLKERFNGEKISVGGKFAPNKAQKKVFSNKNEECILIGYDDMWWYVPRRCLVQ